jgi:hypothetical protein
MLSGSPLNKDWKQKKIVDTTEKLPKKIKCAINKAEGRKLTKRACDVGQCEWLERWLTQLVQEMSYPPQLAGSEAYSNLSKFLGTQAETILERLRNEFNLIYPVTG